VTIGEKLYVADKSTLDATKTALDGLTSYLQNLFNTQVTGTAKEAIEAGDLVCVEADGGITLAERYKEISPANLEVCQNNDIAGASFAELTPTTALVVYSDAGDVSHLKAAVVTINDLTVTKGTVYEVAAEASYRVSACKIADNKVLIGWGNSASYKAVVATVSGDTISFGTPVTVFAALPSGAKVDVLDTDKGLIVYSQTTSMYGRAFTVSGTDITLGTQLSLGTMDNTQNALQLTILSPARALISYPYSSNRYVNTVNISGTTLTIGTTSAPLTGNYGWTVVRLTDDTALLIVGYNLCWITTNGTNLLKGQLIAWAGSAPSFLMAVVLGTGKVLINYGDTSIMYCKIIKLEGNAYTLIEAEMAYPVSPYVYSGGWNLAKIALLKQGRALSLANPSQNPNYRAHLTVLSYSEWQGIAQGSAAVGENVAVLQGGDAAVYTNLVPGRMYYQNKKTPAEFGPKKVGVALNATTLKITNPVWDR